MGLQPRIPPSPTLLHDRSLSNNQFFLARLVRKANCPLDSSRSLGSSFRARLPDNLHLSVDICHRRIQNLLCQCIGSVCHHAEHCWSVVPSCCGSALCEAWGFVGYFGPWVCQSCVHPDSICIALLWSLDSEEESVLSAVVGRRYAEGWKWNQDSGGSLRGWTFGNDDELMSCTGVFLHFVTCICISFLGRYDQRA